VVGSRNSSNSNRLQEVAEKAGNTAYLIDGPDDIQADWLHEKNNIGITAGASAPELLVKAVIERLYALGASSVQEIQGREEHVVFAMPKALR
jgi:4-hydroxy-3-methylbut-2-enyl diphosphate reductase